MLRTMLEARAPLYAEVATATVHTGDRPSEEVVAEVLAALPASTGTGR
jgi:shikimate kinase